MERNGQGPKWPGNERGRELVGQGANRPESYWPIRSRERIGPGAKRLGTVRFDIAFVTFKSFAVVGDFKIAHAAMTCHVVHVMCNVSFLSSFHAHK